MGNGWCDIVGWNLLPDNLLLSIFSYLNAKDLVAVSEVCWHWSNVSKDNSLWKRLLSLDFKISPRAQISPFNVAGSWLSEYRRLTDEYPKVESEVLSAHVDEVLHVCFNGTGSMFATCSKDCTLKIWQNSSPCRLMYDENLSEMFHWQYTQFSQFNADDNLIMVSGVHVGPHTTSGEIAIFEIKDDGLEFRSRVLNKPYDVFGCWYDRNHVINGELHWISPMSSTSDIYLCSASQEIESERKAVMARLYRFFNRNANTVHMTLVSNHVSSWIRYAVEMTEKFVAAEKAGTEFDLGQDLAFDNWDEKRKADEASGSADAGSSFQQWPDKLLMFCTGTLTYTPHQVGFKLLRGSRIRELFNADVMPPERVQAVMDRIRQHQESIQNADNELDDDGVAMNVGDDAELEQQQQQPDQEDPNVAWQEILDKFDFPDHIIEMNGHIIGMALTKDERYLFVNVRPWPDGCVVSNPWEPPPIAQQIEVRVIDLETLALSDIRYRSHKGFTPNDECFFIFLDACDRYVASGSEDNHAYVWDRHFGCPVGKLQHTNVVNSVAFHPRDPSMLISASDDQKIKIWRSKAYVRESSQEKK